MRVKDFIEREFESIQRRHAEELRELAIRCCEQCEADGYTEGFRDGIGLDSLALRIVSLALRVADGRLDIERLKQAAEEWNETLDNARRNID